MSTHSLLTGRELHEPYQFVQEADPGAVGAKLYWLKISTGILKRRNDANAAWVTISPAPAVITTFLGLTDTPSSYVGAAGRIATVNMAETALEFTTPGSGGGGAVIAVKSVTKTDTQTTTSANGTWVDITGLSITYTPTSVSNLILARFDVFASGDAGTNGVMLRMIRDAVPIGIGDAAGTRTQATTSMIGSNASVGFPISGSVLDAPATTSSTTYKVQFCSLTGAGGTAYINRTSNDTNSAVIVRGVSTFTLMEVTP